MIQTMIIAGLYSCLMLIVLRIITGEALLAIGPRQAAREAEHLCLLVKNADMRYADAYPLYKRTVGAFYLLYGTGALDKLGDAGQEAIPILVERSLREQWGDEEMDRYIEDHGPIN